MDKRTALCYPIPVDPDIKRISCVKGANMVSKPQGCLGLTSVAVPLWTRRFLFWEVLQWKHG